MKPAGVAATLVPPLVEVGLELLRQRGPTGVTSPAGDFPARLVTLPWATAQGRARSFRLLFADADADGASPHKSAFDLTMRARVRAAIGTALRELRSAPARRHLGLCATDAVNVPRCALQGSSI